MTMLHIQEYLQTHTLDQLKEEFEINFKVYDDRVILKYGITTKQKYSQIVAECRGLVLSLPDYKVLARGFDRFFNLGEDVSNQKHFDWDNCIVTQKMDGSLAKCYFDGVKWCVSTNGTAFAEGPTPMGKTYHDLFVEAIGMDLQEAFQYSDPRYTYIFELTSPENRIVTRYSETKATLLAIRDNVTGDHLDYDILKTAIHYLSFKTSLVESYDINNEADVVKFVESLDQLDEGVVLYDGQTRIKVKSASYVAIHHLRNGITVKSIVTLLLKGEMAEYCVYFPEDMVLMQPYINKFNQLKQDITDTYNKYKHLENQKDFAMKVKDLPYSGFLFSLRKGLTLDSLFDIKKVSQIVKYFEEV
jgi:T4 RnlA family RNA ligase